MPEAHKTYHRRKLTAYERFFDGYEVASNGCWNWRRAWRSNKYGYMWLNGKAVKASRASWFFFRGEIPEGMYICHTCDNPKCVNPEHLFLGTPKDNMQDMISKGRQVVRRGECAPNVKLTLAQVREIKQSKLKGIELARRYGVGPMQISRIRRGLRWGHING